MFLQPCRSPAGWRGTSAHGWARMVLGGSRDGSTDVGALDWAIDGPAAVRISRARRARRMACHGYRAGGERAVKRVRRRGRFQSLTPAASPAPQTLWVPLLSLWGRATRQTISNRLASTITHS